MHGSRFYLSACIVLLCPVVTAASAARCGGSSHAEQHNTGECSPGRKAAVPPGQSTSPTPFGVYLRRVLVVSLPANPGAAAGLDAAASTGRAVQTASTSPVTVPMPLADAAVAEFRAAFLRRLRERIGAATVPDSDIARALRAAALPGRGARTQDTAGEICRRLDCDAAFACSLDRSSVSYAPHAAVRLWFQVEMLYTHGELLPARRGRRGRRLSAPPLFYTAGWASADEGLLADRTRSVDGAMVRRAARLAASSATHMVETGQADPLTVPGVRVAISLLEAPARISGMRFGQGGRKIFTCAEALEPKDREFRYVPYLLPLRAAAVIRLQPDGQRNSSDRRLETSGYSRSEITSVCALGRRLGVDYVLASQVVDVQAESGPPEAAIVRSLPAGADGMKVAGGVHTEISAQADARGALIRVRDGRVLWSDLCSASLRRAGDRGAPGLPAVAGEAAHFALVDLQRKFADYRRSFLK